MLSIYLRPDCTQAAMAHLRRDRILEVTDARELESYFDAFTDSEAGYDSHMVPELSRMFQDMKDNFRSIRTEEVYLVLPDFLFSVIDIFDYVSDENLRTLVEEELSGESLDNFYYTIPITVRLAVQKKTVYAIRKSYIDAIIEAAKEEHIAIASVEPASLSFFRAYGDWPLDHPLVEIFEDNATITTYSPAGGIFRTEANTLRWGNLLTHIKQANGFVAAAYAANDLSASKSFPSMRTDAPYIILTGNPKVFGIDNIKARLPGPNDRPNVFPEFVQTSFLAPTEEGQWMPVIGTMLQCYDAFEGVQNPVYDMKPRFIDLQSGNLLPDAVRMASKNQQWKTVAVKTCRTLSIGLVILMAAETAAALYFSMAEPDPVLSKDYQSVQEQKAGVEKEIRVIREAKGEDKNVLGGFEAVIRSRPDGVGFTDLSVGSDDPNAKDADNRFVKLTAVSTDTMKFQSFRDALAEEPALSSPSISNISGDASGLQRADFVTGRGK